MLHKNHLTTTHVGLRGETHTLPRGQAFSKKLTCKHPKPLRKVH